LLGLVSIQDILESIFYPPVRMGNQDVAGEQLNSLALAAKGS
jgi:hypothetical protein